jgi:hypothetical protein
MGLELVKSGNGLTPVPSVGIRIEVDMATDDELEAWADRERRSKREHVGYLVRQMLEAYRSDPFILHRLALARAGATQART